MSVELIRQAFSEDYAGSGLSLVRKPYSEDYDISIDETITTIEGADIFAVLDDTDNKFKKITGANIFASPPAIGGTTPAAGKFTDLGVSGNINVGNATPNGNLAGGLIIKEGTPASANVTDGVQLWVAQGAQGDGYAALKFRTEDGTVGTIGKHVSIGRDTPVGSDTSGGRMFTLQSATSGQNVARFELLGSRTDSGTYASIEAFLKASTVLAAISFKRDGADTSTAITFDTENAGAYAERMRITKEGTVEMIDVDIAAGTVDIPLTSGRVFDALATNLPAAGSVDDFGLITGTPGTNAPSLQTEDVKTTDAISYAAFLVKIPHWYKAGSTVTLRLSCGMVTTVADQSCLVDVSAWVTDYANNDLTVSGDLCETAQQSMNSTTFANKDFVIDDDASGYVLTPGSILQIQVLADWDDNATGTAVIACIRHAELIISA